MKVAKLYLDLKEINKNLNGAFKQVAISSVIADDKTLEIQLVTEKQEGGLFTAKIRLTDEGVSRFLGVKKEQVMLGKADFNFREVEFEVFIDGDAETNSDVIDMSKAEYFGNARRQLFEL